MAGIIDRKSRIIDYSLTENGRSQIQSGDIRYVYASISDKSIVYEKDHEKSLLNSEDISFTDNYLPIEVDTKTFGYINNEFNLEDTFTIKNSNIINTVKSLSESYSNVTFDEAANIFIEKNSTGLHLKNLGLISQKTFLPSKGMSFVEKSSLSRDFDFVNKSFITKYPTVKKLNSRSKDMKTIAIDKRFKHKTSFMEMIPEDINGNKLYDESYFEKDEASNKDLCIDMIYKTLNIDIEYENITDRDELISKAIEKISNSNIVQKREYTIRQSTELDSFIFNMYEINKDVDSLEKLAIINLGRIFGNNTSNGKHVYLAGKIVKSRNDSRDLDELYTFSQGEILKNTKNTNFAISAYYSFVCLFTIVLE